MVPSHLRGRIKAKGDVELHSVGWVMTCALQRYVQTRGDDIKLEAWPTFYAIVV